MTNFHRNCYEEMQTLCLSTESSCRYHALIVVPIFSTSIACKKRSTKIKVQLHQDDEPKNKINKYLGDVCLDKNYSKIFIQESKNGVVLKGIFMINH
jgi:hypothetical protein